MSDEMPEMPGILKKLLGIKENVDYSKWAQVGKLDSDDMVKRRKMMAAIDEQNDQIEQMLDTIKMMKVKAESEQNEWWRTIRKKYGIPKGNLHLERDGKILMEPNSNE